MSLTHSDQAKENAKLLAEKLPFAELRDGKFRRHPQRPVLADLSKLVDLNQGQLTRKTYPIDLG